MGYHQLNSEERLELYRLRQETNLLMRAIAKKMGRSHTTISRELQQNQDPSLKTYLPDSANSQAQERRHHAQELFQSFTSQQIEEIRSRLKLYHSPEQIAGRLKKEELFVISHEVTFQG
jgi:IS30 family transposase